MRSRVIACVQGPQWGNEAGRWMLWVPDDDYTLAHWDSGGNGSSGRPIASEAEASAAS